MKKSAILYGALLLALIHGGVLFAEPEAVRDSLATAVGRLVLPR